MDATSLDFQCALLLKVDPSTHEVHHWHKTTFAGLPPAKVRGMMAKWLHHIGAAEGDEVSCVWGDPSAPDAEEWMPAEQLGTKLQAHCLASGVALDTSEALPRL